MAYNRFYISIIIRSVLLAVNALIFAFFIIDIERIFTAIFFASIFIIQLLFLIYYLNRTNRELASFLISLKEGNTTIAFSQKNIEKTFKGLRKSFEKISEELKTIRLNSTLREQYLNIIVENAGAGLLAYDHNEKIILSNKSAKSLLNQNLTDNLAEIVKTNPVFYKTIKSAKPGQQELVIEKTRTGLRKNLSIRSSILKTEQDLITIISFHNINKELEEKEMDSWKDLTRVITHEIMNSLTTIPTLTATIKDCLSKEISLDNNKSNEISDALECSNMIEERSISLISFAEKFRNLNKVPQLNISKVYIRELFNRVDIFMKQNVNVNFKIDIDTDKLFVFADEKLLEQILINLVKNSIESLSNLNESQIIFKAYKNNNDKVIIQVYDNGPGIQPEIIDRIFIPFFTTKKAGSGIGLSFIRQIIREHNGSINVRSTPGVETVFTIEL